MVRLEKWGSEEGVRYRDADKVKEINQESCSKQDLEKQEAVTISGTWEWAEGTA